MTPFVRWTKPDQPLELMCIKCGAIRPTLHLPSLEVDAITRTFGPLLILSSLIREEQKPWRFSAHPSANHPLRGYPFLPAVPSASLAHRQRQLQGYPT